MTKRIPYGHREIKQTNERTNQITLSVTTPRKSNYREEFNWIMPYVFTRSAPYVAMLVKRWLLSGKRRRSKFQMKWRTFSFTCQRRRITNRRSFFVGNSVSVSSSLDLVTDFGRGVNQGWARHWLADIRSLFHCKNKLR